MIDSEKTDITNCTPEEMDSYFGILNVMEGQKKQKDYKTLFTEKKIEEIFLNDHRTRKIKV